jgi:hypothetical protein
MQLIDAYGANDELSMVSDNTLLFRGNSPRGFAYACLMTALVSFTRPTGGRTQLLAGPQL